MPPSLRHETPHATVTTLVTGHFRETPDYAVWRPRGTQDWLLIVTLEGRGRFGGASGRTGLFVERGDAVLLRPGTPHDYGTAGGARGWELLWAHFAPRPHWIEWLDWPEIEPAAGGESENGPMHLSLTDVSANLFSKVTARLGEAHRHLTTSALPRRDEFARNALEEALLWCDTANPRAASARRDARVQAAMGILLARLGDTIPMAALARSVNLSPSRLGRLFREQVGQTPQQWVERERMARAMQLLALSSRTIANIAAEVGYDNPFYFSLRFKQHTGHSPRDWRQRAAHQQASGDAAEQ